MPNTYSQIFLHIVFSPKYRSALMKPSFQDDLYKYITNLTKELNQNMIQINGIEDHIHLLVRLRPAMAPAVFVQKIKANSSRWINQQGFLDVDFKWQVGSGIFSVGYKHVDVVSRYIKNQKEHHKKTNFKKEYVNILKAADIAFKDEFLFKFFD